MKKLLLLSIILIVGCFLPPSEPIDSTPYWVKRDRRIAERQAERQKLAQSKYDEWIGKNKSEIIADWGPYTRKIEDGLGGEIVIYETLKKEDSKIITNSYSDDIKIREGRLYTVYKDVYIDSSNLIYKIRWGRR